MTAAPMVVRAALGCELRIHPQEYELSLTVAHKREVRFAVNFLRFHFASASYMVGVFRDAIVVLPMLDQALKLLGKSLDFGSCPPSAAELLAPERRQLVSVCAWE
jgi:hypothetical protein